MFRLSTDKLNLLLRGPGRPSRDLLEEFYAAWRAAAHDRRRAFRAWSVGEGTYEAVVAAMDREQAAASALARYQAQLSAPRSD